MSKKTKEKRTRQPAMPKTLLGGFSYIIVPPKVPSKFFEVRKQSADRPLVNPEKIYTVSTLDGCSCLAGKTGRDCKHYAMLPSPVYHDGQPHVFQGSPVKYEDADLLVDSSNLAVRKLFKPVTFRRIGAFRRARDGSNLRVVEVLGLASVWHYTFGDYVYLYTELEGDGPSASKDKLLVKAHLYQSKILFDLALDRDSLWSNDISPSLVF